MGEESTSSRDLAAGLAEAFGSDDGQSVLLALGAVSGQDLRIGGAQPSPSGGAPERRYEVLGEIARGGMGVVMRTRDVDLGRDVAMKVLRSEFARDAQVLSHFLEEAQIGGQLQHPGIVPVYEMGVRGDRQAYFTMKLIRGQTLAELLRRRADPSQDRRRFLSVFEAVCQTVAYAHSRNVIHRDLKPANVMVGSFGEVQVVDWGFAKVIDGPASPHRDSEAEDPPVRTVRSGSSFDRSQVGSAMGTPAYMPPEQAYGDGEHTDERSDVFSLGATLCEILTGAPPYRKEDGNQLVQAARRQVEGAFERLDACGADPELVDLVRRCMAPHDERPRNGAAVAEAISGYLGAVEERARRAQLRAAAEQVKAQEERKRRRLTAALAAAVLVLVIGGGGTWALVHQGRLDRIRGNTLAVSRDIRQAAQLEAQARSDDGLPRWDQASLAARQAVERARVDEVDASVAREAQEFMARIEASREEAVARAAGRARDEAMAARLHEIGQRRDHVLHREELDADYRAAFREYGLDPTREEPERSAERIRGSAIADEICAALDNWAQTVRGVGAAEDELALRLIDAAARADPDPWRAAVREAGGARDAARLLALRDAAASEDLPVSSVRLLASYLAQTLDFAAAIGVLRRAQAVHPGDYGINFRLGVLLHAQASQTIGEPDESQALVRESLGYLRAALGARPADLETRHHLAIVQEKLGNHEEALAVLHQCLRLKPDYDHLWVHVVENEWALGRLDEALARTHDEARQDPGNARIAWRLGLLHHAAKRLEAASEAFEEATELDEDFGPAWLHLGRTCWELERLEQAAVALERAAQLEPYHGLVFYLQGRVREGRGDLPGAMAAYEQAVRKTPGKPLFRTAAATALARAHRPGEAMRHYEALADVYGEVQSVLKLEFELASAFWQEGYEREARTIGARAVPRLRGLLGEAAEPSQVPNLVKLAGFLCDVEWQFDEAIQIFRKVIPLRANSPAAHWGLAVALEKKGDVAGARQAYETYLERWPGRANTHRTLGFLCLEQGELPQARAHLEAALRIDEGSSPVHGLLSIAAMWQGDYDAALAHHRRFYELHDWPGGTAPWSAQEWAATRERTAALAQRRAALLDGTEVLTDARDMLLFGLLLWDEFDQPGALRFFDAALQADPSLRREVVPAACLFSWGLARAVAAGAAGLGVGPAAAALDEQERRRLRERAIEGLREELALLDASLSGADAIGRARVDSIVDHLRNELRRSRYGDLLPSLPAREQDAWARVWEDADRLMRNARGGD